MIMKRIASGVILSILTLLVPACSEAPPEGTPIDFEAVRTFKPFKLMDLDSQERELADFFSELTLVAFFFPT